MELDKYKINNNICDVTDLKDNMKKLIQQNLDYVVKFHISDNTLFYQYINVLAYTKMAIWELRNEYSETMFFDEFDSLPDETHYSIFKKYPLRIYDTND